MEEFVKMQVPQEKAEPKRTYRVWHYKVEKNRHEIKHTICIHDGVFTHVTEMDELGQTMKQREDVRIEDVCSVTSYFGISRNIGLVILLGLLGVLGIVGGIVMMCMTAVKLGLIALLFGLIMGGLAYLVFRCVRASFILEFDTVIPRGTLKNTELAYGNAVISTRRTRFSQFWRRRRYKLYMPVEVGNDIVESIGELLING